MKAHIVPEEESKVKATALKLIESGQESMVIEGADNETLVKVPSALAKEMIEGNRVLVPFSLQGHEFLVCITEIRR